MAEEKPNLNLLRAADIAPHVEQHSFSHPWNARSEVRGAMLGRMVGLKRTGVNLARLAPGKESFVYHAHQLEEEWIYILEGRGRAHIDGVEYEVGPGDFMAFPTPSVAHHLLNAGSEDLLYLMGGENRDVEISDFPTLGKRMIRCGETIEVFDVSDAKPFGPL